MTIDISVRESATGSRESPISDGLRAASSRRGCWKCIRIITDDAAVVYWVADGIPLSLYIAYSDDSSLRDVYAAVCDCDYNDTIVSGSMCVTPVYDGGCSYVARLLQATSISLSANG